MTGEKHVPFETLSDYVDGSLERAEALVLERHLAGCQVCSAEHHALRAMLSSSADLPDSVLPPDDIWPDLKLALNSRKLVALPTSESVKGGAPTVLHRRRLAWHSNVRLAAAAVILVVASSSITAVVLRLSDGRGLTEITPQRAPDRLDPSRSVLPVSFRQTELEYNRTIDELELAVNTQRGQLTPETIRTVDRSLAVIDSAIAEARAALVADPNNRMLVDLLSSSYQRKLDLLRRTSELGSKI
jgi:putative zinc finger protein